jgi:hypothetical protein
MPSFGAVAMCGGGGGRSRQSAPPVAVLGRGLQERLETGRPSGRRDAHEHEQRQAQRDAFDEGRVEKDGEVDQAEEDPAQQQPRREPRGRRANDEPAQDPPTACALISHPSSRAPPPKATLANGGSSMEKPPSFEPHDGADHKHTPFTNGPSGCPAPAGRWVASARTISAAHRGRASR